MSATPQFGVKLSPNLAPCKQCLKPHDARNGYHEPTMSTNRPLQVNLQGSENYEGKGQGDTHELSKS